MHLDKPLHLPRPAYLRPEHHKQVPHTAGRPQANAAARVLHRRQRLQRARVPHRAQPVGDHQRGVGRREDRGGKAGRELRGVGGRFRLGDRAVSVRIQSSFNFNFLMASKLCIFECFCIRVCVFRNFRRI